MRAGQWNDITHTNRITRNNICPYLLVGPVHGIVADILDSGQSQGEQMGLGGEEVIINGYGEVLWLSEEEIQVLEGLRQEEGIHAEKKEEKKMTLIRYKLTTSSWYKNVYCASAWD